MLTGESESLSLHPLSPGPQAGMLLHTSCIPWAWKEKGEWATDRGYLGLSPALGLPLLLPFGARVSSFAFDPLPSLLLVPHLFPALSLASVCLLGVPYPICVLAFLPQ